MASDNLPGNVTLAIDAMGGDFAPGEIIKGADIFAKSNPDVKLLLHGNENEIKPIISTMNNIKNYQIIHADDKVTMDAKPSQAMRKKNTSMWGAINSVKTSQADAIISAGNTGALMAISNLQLRTIEGLHRPAIAAFWPNAKGKHTIVLDVGANVDSDPEQLLEFAIMGEAYARAITNNSSPSVGLLNIGSEDVKGHEDIKEAMRLLREFGSELGINVYGFVEGNDISMGTTDVVVTDGFTGNVALKAAEGAAKLIAKALKESLKADIVSSLGALIASKGFNRFKDRLDPRSSNGGLLLGLNGIVVKSHGGTDAIGFYNAICVAHKLVCSDYKNTVSSNLKRLIDIRKNTATSEIVA